MRPDGTINLGFYGDLHVAGLTLSEIEAKMLPPLPPADEEPSKAEKDAKDTAEKKELFKDLF